MMTKSFLIKVCGMRDANNIREVERLRVGDGTSGMAHGIDLMGFIFWSKSGRYVSEIPAYMPEKCKRVGVFVNEDIETIRQIIHDYGLDIIQLHGTESPDYIRSLRSICVDDIAIIKAFNIATISDLEQSKPYVGIADYFLFDTRMPPEETRGGLPPGGTGKKFDWSVLEAYDGQTPFFLSGGIGPDDATRVKEMFSKKCVGIDLNSKFEVEPGLKDINKLKQFLEQL